jgi:hypothetical protein
VKRTNKPKSLPQRQRQCIPDEEPSPSPPPITEAGPSMDEHVVKILGIIAEAKELCASKRGRLIGWIDRLFDEHDRLEGKL